MQRDKSLDFGKGVAMILVVIGHCYSFENYVLQLIYAFHMPFFFIASGMLYSEKWKDRVSLNIYKSAKRLLVPYLIFETLYAGLLAVLNRSGNFLTVLREYITKSVLTGVGITATWYLPCSLIVCMLFVIISKLTKSKKMQLCIILIITIMGLCISVPRYLIVLWRAFVGLGFFSVGFYGKEILKFKVKNTIVFAITILYLYFANINGMVSMVSMNYSNPLLYMANGVIGSYLLLQLSFRIVELTELQMIETTGKNSIVILCTHMIIIEIIRLLDYKLLGGAVSQLGYMEGIVLGFVILSISYMRIPLCNRYFKFAFGK